MRIILNLIILGLQAIITFVTLIVVYMILVLMDYQGGVDSFIGTTLFQPIIGGLISIVTIGICVLIGLPIRISDRVNTWWIKRIWLSILGVVAGLTLLIFSLLPSMTETINTIIENEVIQRQIPNTNFAITGWFLTGFSLLHLFPPYKLRIWTEEMIAKIRGGGSENARQQNP
jgi:uncharacterized membrane protein